MFEERVSIKLAARNIDEYKMIRKIIWMVIVVVVAIINIIILTLLAPHKIINILVKNSLLHMKELHCVWTLYYWILH